MSMMISVVIPCFNAERFVHRAIESVLRQDYNDFEIILVNNNSTDGTGEVLEQYRSLHPQKIKVLQETRKGAPAARNTGMEASTGNYIQFLDADDELLPGKLKRQARLAEEQTPDLIVGDFFRVVTARGRSLKIAKTPNNENIWIALITARLGITSANLWRKEAVMKVGKWNEALTSSQEYDLMFRLLKSGTQPVYDIAAPSALVYFEEGSISRTKEEHKNIEVTENYLRLRLEIKDYLKAQGLLTEAVKMKLDQYIYFYLSDKKNVIPEYVSRKIDDLKLKVGIMTRIKYQMKYAVKSMLTPSKT